MVMPFAVGQAFQPDKHRHTLGWKARPTRNRYAAANSLLTRTLSRFPVIDRAARLGSLP
jgi:hypothetical protein